MMSLVQHLLRFLSTRDFILADLERLRNVLKVRKRLDSVPFSADGTKLKVGVSWLI
jgi:hypothetical protein